jgi:class 3 adenylate cyclase/Flp pilus assembly protein TadD
MAAGEVDAEELFLRGMDCHQFGLFDEAVEIFGEIIKANPGDGQAFRARGSVLSDLGRWEEALGDYGSAIRLDPSDAEAYFLRGNENLDLGRREDALADFAGAARLCPQMARAHYNTGLARLSLGDTPGAVESFGRSISIDPTLARGYHNRGKALLDMGRTGEALADFEEAIRLTPYEAATYHNRGNALWLLGRREEAVYDYNTFILRAGPPYGSFIQEDQRLLEDMKKGGPPRPGWASLPKAVTYPKIDRMHREATLFVDICGSTGLVNTYGGFHFYAIFSVLERIFDAHAQAHGRLYRKGLGDGFMAIFPDCKSALAACVKTMDGLDRHNTSARESHRINVRVGVDFGETAVSRDEDRFGVPVNVAKRIEGAIAADFTKLHIPQDRFPPENRIFISYITRKSVGDDPSFFVEPVGLATLRGLERIGNEIYMVDWRRSAERIGR